MGHRWETDGPVFFGQGLSQTGQGPDQVRRWVWIGDGTKIRCHEGEVEIGPKTVFGQECTISAYRRVRIGAECVIADRPCSSTPITGSSTSKSAPRRPGHPAWSDDHRFERDGFGYGAAILRGGQGSATNSVIGTTPVVTRTFRRMR